jgi:hypothetical protein
VRRFRKHFGTPKVSFWAILNKKTVIIKYIILDII